MKETIIFKNTVNVPSGLDNVAKMIYGALLCSDIVTPFLIQNPDSSIRSAQERKALKDAKYNIIVGVPYSFEKYIEPNKINIGYSMWETDKIPDSFDESLGKLDLLFVPTQQNVDIFKSHCKRVEKLPVPCPMQKIPYINLDREKIYTFYSIYNWTERKSPLESILAFCEEFDPSENVRFVIKIKGASPGTNIQKEIKEMLLRNNILSNPKVEIVVKAWTQQEMNIFHRRSHCYVCLSKGEGFCLPLMDAYLFGNQVISTNCGVVEYLTKAKRLHLVKSKMTPVKNMGWFEYVDETHNWFNPDIKSTRKAMRTVFKNWENNKKIDIEEINKSNAEFLKKIGKNEFASKFDEALKAQKSDN